jgi:F-type H+-transporting ATPase subunit epsilon
VRLRIITPLELVVDEVAVSAVRAEDATGSFGILAGHANFLTSLAVSVVEWKRIDGTRRYCAVRRGMLSVSGGTDVAVATREAIANDDLETLDATVLARFRADIELERSERFETIQLQLSAIRRIVSQFQPGGVGGRILS